MNGFAKILVRVALWLVDHPDTIKTLVDAIHESKQAKPVTAAAR